LTIAAMAGVIGFSVFFAVAGEEFASVLRILDLPGYSLSIWHIFLAVALGVLGCSWARFWAAPRRFEEIDRSPQWSATHPRNSRRFHRRADFPAPVRQRRGRNSRQSHLSGHSACPGRGVRDAGPFALAVIARLIAGISVTEAVPVFISAFVAYFVTHGLGLLGRGSAREQPRVDERTNEGNVEQ
jgi:hypothetical protein